MLETAQTTRYFYAHFDVMQDLIVHVEMGMWRVRLAGVARDLDDKLETWQPVLKRFQSFL